MLIFKERFAAVLFVLVLFPRVTFGQALTITTFAGQPGGSDDGTGHAARFLSPAGVATDGAGNLYIADAGNHTIRKMSAAGVVTTLAGLAGVSGSDDGAGSSARFSGPASVALDVSGNVYVADSNNGTIRKITPRGMVTTLAGRARSSGSADGTGEAARFARPSSVAVGPSGHLYVADSSNSTIRKITLEGVVTTLAGVADFAGRADGTGSSAQFNHPDALATDGGGNVYVADTENYTVRKISPAGVVTTLAGLAGSAGAGDGIGNDARFDHPHGIAVDSSGTVYVAEFLHWIRRITPSGTVSTLAGLAGTGGNADGVGSAARFSVPAGLAAAPNGDVYVADSSNNTIRRITTGGVVTTLGPRGSSGSDDGNGDAARFFWPSAVAVDGNGTLYVADYANCTIRRISPQGVVTTVAGLARGFGSSDGQGSEARFFFPDGIAIDGNGNVYVSDSFSNTIRKITTDGTVTTFAGSRGLSGSADGAGSTARFRSPGGLATDANGNLYVADRSNHTVRKITPDGTVTTFAGLAGNTGRADGSGTEARFDYPSGLAIDRNGNVYVADRNNYMIRKITAAGVVTTLAGSGSSGNADGLGRAAEFSVPMGVALDSAGNLYVADTGNQLIRKMSTSGAVTTVAGLVRAIGGADGTGSDARFVYPQGIACGPDGIYVADSENNVIRKGSPALTDVATIDHAVGTVGSTSVLDTSPQTASSWEWSVIRRPSGSAATLSSSSSRNPTFTPDVGGLYQFRVIARGLAGSSITVVSLQAADSPLGRHRVARH